MLGTANLILSAMVKRLGELGSWLAGASLLAMMLIGAIDVIGTKFFDRPLPAALEVTEALMVFGAFLGLAYTQANRQHIVVDLLPARLGAAVQRALYRMGQLLTFGAFLLIAWEGWVLGLASVEIREYAPGLLQFPIYPAKLALAVGATLGAFQSGLDVITSVRRRAP